MPIHCLELSWSSLHIVAELSLERTLWIRIFYSCSISANACCAFSFYRHFQLSTTLRSWYLSYLFHSWATIATSRVVVCILVVEGVKHFRMFLNFEVTWKIVAGHFVVYVGRRKLCIMVHQWNLRYHIRTTCPFEWL